MDAVVVSGARTPIGRAYKGSLAGVDAFELARVAVGGAIKRSGVPADELDDVILAESMQGGGAIARHIAIDLGLLDVPGIAVNRHCAASLSAVQLAAGSIAAGMDRAIVAGGTESISTMPIVTTRSGAPWWPPTHVDSPEAPNRDMSITVGENTARIAGVTREQADEWALHSHLRAAAAITEGRFDDEIVPVGSFTRDEHPRGDTTIEKLAALPVLHPELPGATVTAGNAAGMNDAASAVVVTSADFARANGLAPMARIVSWASVGVDPIRTGLAPTIAVPKALERAGMTIGDVDLFEINEAMCSMAVASTRVLGIDHSIVNVNGSGCGLGHPVAATGTRMLLTTMFELRRRGGTIGCVAMCAGGGMGSALVFELV